MTENKSVYGISAGAITTLLFLIAVSGCTNANDAEKSTDKAPDADKGLPSAEKMAEALIAVDWVISQGKDLRIETPWGKVGEDGYIDFLAMLEEEDIKSLEGTGVTATQFVAGMRAMNPVGGLVPVAGTEGRINAVVSDQSNRSEYGAKVSKCILKQKDSGTKKGQSAYGEESFILCTKCADGFPVGYGKGSHIVMGRQTAPGAVIVVCAKEGLNIAGREFQYRQVVLFDEKDGDSTPRVATPQDKVVITEDTEIFGKTYSKGAIRIPEDGKLPE